jgi:hypothetical protein
MISFAFGFSVSRFSSAISPSDFCCRASCARPSANPDSNCVHDDGTNSSFEPLTRMASNCAGGTSGKVRKLTEPGLPPPPPGPPLPAVPPEIEPLPLGPEAFAMERCACAGTVKIMPRIATPRILFIPLPIWGTLRDVQPCGQRMLSSIRLRFIAFAQNGDRKRDGKPWKNQ